MKKFAVLFLACFLSVVAPGCGSGGLDNLNQAKGVITLDGQPLAEAQITLCPTQSGMRSAGANSDEKGVFVFQTLKGGDGVADGEYQVTVTKSHMENPYTDEEVKIINESGGKRPETLFPDREPPALVNDLPERYGNPNTSGLTLTISGSSKDLKLELTSEE